MKILYVGLERVCVSHAEEGQKEEHQGEAPECHGVSEDTTVICTHMDFESSRNLK